LSAVHVIKGTIAFTFGELIVEAKGEEAINIPVHLHVVTKDALIEHSIDAYFFEFFGASFERPPFLGAITEILGAGIARAEELDLIALLQEAGRSTRFGEDADVRHSCSI